MKRLAKKVTKIKNNAIICDSATVYSKYSVTKRTRKQKKQNKKKRKKTGVKWVIFLTLSVYVARGRGGG